MNRIPENLAGRAGRQKERGVVLVISLIILLIMTLMGVTAMQTTTLEERMAGHLRDGTLAFEAGEGALREAADVVSGWVAEPARVDNVYLGDEAPPAPPVEVVEGGAELTELGADLGLSADRYPVYVVQDVGFVPDTLSAEAMARRVGRHYYAVTVRAWGGTSDSRVLLQTVVEKRFR